MLNIGAWQDGLARFWNGTLSGLAAIQQLHFHSTQN